MLTTELRDSIVKRLIQQYHEYVALQVEVDALKQEKIISAGEGIDAKIELLKKLQEQTGNEMTFATPLVWILYKARAYKDTPQAIDTVGDFRAHCSPEGYICTRRYAFIVEYLEAEGADISIHNENIPLKDFATLPEIAGLEADSIFMQHWQAQEYYRKDGEISKWQRPA